MKLIVGLGNPGEKYSRTRHNLGHIFIDYLAKTNTTTATTKPLYTIRKVLNTTLFLAKTNTFMNQSGQAVAKLISFYKGSPNDLYLVHDDLDLKLGEYKIQKGTGPKDHNGIHAVENVLGTKDFWRVRIGIDNRKQDNRVPGEDYVLQNFSQDEFNSIKTTFPALAKKLYEILPV